MSENVLINDPRLTPTMDRIRSGKTQLFREKNKDDRSFIGHDNCDVSLEHKNKAMYAELIDGEWYWVSGCRECNGQTRGFSYVECDEHDVCSRCGISRKEIKGSVLGGCNGWTCKPCQEVRDLELRRQAFFKLDGEEPDCRYCDKIICPHCGSEINSDDIHEDQDLKCHVCEGDLSVEVGMTIGYSTTIKGERITE